MLVFRLQTHLEHSKPPSLPLHAGTLCNVSYANTKKFACLAESVGDWWFREIAHAVVESHFYRSELTEAIRFSHSEFCFVVQTFDDAGRKRSLGFEPVEDEGFVTSDRARFFLERLNPGTHDAQCPSIHTYTHTHTPLLGIASTNHL